MKLGMDSLTFGLIGSGGGDFVNLDFGASSIKIAQGTYNEGSPPSIDLNMADREPVGNPAPNERISEFSNALKVLLERNSIESDQKAVLALPTNVVIVRHLELPAMPDERMSQVIRYEAESHIPFPLEDVVLDYHIIERTEEGTEIILIAVKEEKLNEYVGIAHNAGLNPEIIDISAFSVFNLYRQMGINGDEEEDPSAKVLVDVGHANTDIIIFKGETLHFARSASIAGESITEQISKKLGIDIDEAKSLKHEYGHIPLEEIDDGDVDLDEGGDALDDLADKKEASGESSPEDSVEMEQEETDEAEEQEGEEDSLGLGAPKSPESDEAESPSDESSTDEDDEADTSGLGLGTPKSPGEEGDEETDQEESTQEPSSPSVPEEEEDSAEDEQGDQPSAPAEPTPGEESDEEDSGGGIDLGLGETKQPSDSEDTSDDAEVDIAEEGDAEADEDQAEPDAPDLGQSEQPSATDDQSDDESAAIDDDVETEPSPPDEAPEPESDSMDEAPEPPEPSDEAPAPPVDSSDAESADSMDSDDGEPPEPPGDTPADTDEDVSEEPPSPDAEVSGDEDDAPSAPGDDSTDSSPPPPGEPDQEEDEDGDGSLGLGSSKQPSETDAESQEDDTQEEGDEGGGNLNLGSSLSDEGDDEDDDEEDDEDDGDSSLTLGAAENTDDDAEEAPEDDVDRGKVGRAIKPQVDRLIGELRHTFDYFQSQLGGGEVDEVIIVGGGSNLKNLAPYVEDQLDRPAKKFHPADNVSGVEEGQLQEYLVATGLTLRTIEEVADLEINLIPDDIVEQRKSQYVQQKITAMAVLGGLLLVQLLGSAYFFYETRRQRFNTSKQEFNKLESIVTRIENLKQNQQEMKQRNDVIQRLEDQRTDMLALMRELDQLHPDLPDDLTWFESFDYSVSSPNSGQLNLSGVTRNFNDTSRLYQWLESIEYVKEISSQSQSKNNYVINGEDRSLVSFSVTCEISFGSDSGQNSQEGAG